MQLPVLALVIALLSFGSAYAAEENAEESVDEKANLAHGIWMTDKGRSKVKVGLCEETDGLCTEIVWLREPNNSRGVPLTDGRNQNANLRKRPIMGLKILEGLKQIGRYEWEGSVYNPEDGKTYKANLALVKPDMMRLKGCMAMGWPCRSKFWTRSDLEPPAEMMAEAADAAGPSGDLAGAGGIARQQPEAAATAQAPAEVQTASREAPVALTPPPQSALAAASKPTPPAPDNQPAAQPAPAAAPQPAPAAPSNRAVVPPSRRAYEPPNRTVAAPPPPPPPPLEPVAPAQPQRHAAVAEPPAAPPARIAAPPPPSEPVAPAQPRRHAAVVEPPAAPPARIAAPPPPPPAAAPQPTRPNVYPDVAALPSEPALRRGGDGSNYLVQVAARQNRDEAVAVFNDLRQRYPRLLGNSQPIIKRVNLGELGVWYRVRIGPIAGKAAALSFCNRLKFAGSDCFIRRQ
jgi:uncharacterized protein (DUF2147 family)